MGAVSSGGAGGAANSSICEDEDRMLGFDRDDDLADGFTGAPLVDVSLRPGI
jgi:hypothetical protein